MSTKTKAVAVATEEQGVAPFKLSDFFTTSIASAGRRYPLKKPDGTVSGYCLTVLGADAPAARQALLEATRIIRNEITEEMTDEQKQAISERATLSFRASLVTGWDLPIEFTREALMELLENNPSLATDIENFSGSPARFFGKEPAGSSDTSKKT